MASTPGIRGADHANPGAMADDWQATGVWDAWLIDVLVRVGYDTDAAMQMSAQQRIDAVVAAANDGRLDEATVDQLRSAGILETVQD